LTRRTARFGELARELEERCRPLGEDVPPDAIDRVLNGTVAQTAAAMGVTPRYALMYATEDHMQGLAEDIVTVRRGGA
jgi:hypothetical protein